MQKTRMKKIMVKMFRKLCASVPLCLCAFSRVSVPSFTLIELMVVMVVISILVGITIPVSKYVTRRSREASQKIYIEKIKSGLEDYRAAYGEYPITPTNEGAARHYDNPDYRTECYFTSNSPYQTFDMISSTNLVETLTDLGRRVDYSLTYPLMIKQRAKSARPFVEFKDVPLGYYVWSGKVVLSDVGVGGDTFSNVYKIKTLDGLKPITRKGVMGNPIDRPLAIDPVSQKQWKYTSIDGVTYCLTTNSF